MEGLLKPEYETLIFTYRGIKIMIVPSLVFCP